MKKTMTEAQFEKAIDGLNAYHRPRFDFRRGTKVQRNLKAELNRRQCRGKII